MTFGTAAGGMRKGARKPPLPMYPGGHRALFIGGIGAAAAGISAMSNRGSGGDRLYVPIRVSVS
jgi:hypothetical protein